MDIKIDGLPYEMLEKALIQAKKEGFTYWEKWAKPWQSQEQILSLTHQEW